MVKYINCLRCNKETPRKNSKQKYCIKCGNIVNKERTKERAREKARLRNNG